MNQLKERIWAIVSFMSFEDPDQDVMSLRIRFKEDLI